MIDWAAYDADMEAERKKREGFRAPDYTGERCKNCRRNRVMNCVNGKHVCEKCGWDADANEYSEWSPIGL
jgi:hypothetical protein